VRNISSYDAYCGILNSEGAKCFYPDFKDASERILDITVEEISRFINNQPLKYEIRER